MDEISEYIGKAQMSLTKLRVNSEITESTVLIRFRILLKYERI